METDLGHGAERIATPSTRSRGSGMATIALASNNINRIRGLENPPGRTLVSKTNGLENPHF